MIPLLCRLSSLVRHSILLSPASLSPVTYEGRTDRESPPQIAVGKYLALSIIIYMNIPYLQDTLVSTAALFQQE